MPQACLCACSCRQHCFSGAFAANPFQPYCPINGGLDFISYQFTMDTKMENLWIDLGVLCGFLIFFTFMIYVGLVRVNHLTR